MFNDGGLVKSMTWIVYQKNMPDGTSITLNVYREHSLELDHPNVNSARLQSILQAMHQTALTA